MSFYKFLQAENEIFFILYFIESPVERKNKDRKEIPNKDNIISDRERGGGERTREA